MSQYSLAEGLYLYPTPAGAYYAASSVESDKPRQCLKNILQQQQTPSLTIETLQSLMGHDDEKKCLELLHHSNATPSQYPMSLHRFVHSHQSFF